MSCTSAPPGDGPSGTSPTSPPTSAPDGLVLLGRAARVLPDPVLVLGPGDRCETSVPPPGPLLVVECNEAAETLADAVPGSAVEAAARRVLVTGRSERLRWRPPGAAPRSAVDVVVTALDAVTVTVLCRPVDDDPVAPLLVDAYRVADEAWATLTSALDAAPDAFLVLESRTAAGGSGAAQAVVRHHNRAAAALLGLHEHDVGRTVDRIRDEAWARRLTEALSRARRSPVRYRSQVHDEAGAWLAAYDVTAVVAEPDAGRVVVVVHDATQDESSLRRLEGERVRAEERARCDDLTGLLNRRALHDELRRMLGDGRAAGRVAVVFVDLDGFKAVNDSLGHAAGDAVLAAVARRLERSARAGDVAARYGGDEFVLVLPAVPGDWSATPVLERLALELAEPVWVEGAVLVPRASFGVHLAEPGSRPEDRDPDSVIAAADQAMYRHKAAERSAADPAGHGRQWFAW